jgi:hypothetical protein
MSEILDVLKVKGEARWWLILECSHWYKWTGPAKPPKVGEQIDCPSDTTIKVIGGSEP